MVLNRLQLQCELWVIEAFLFASEPRFEVVQSTHHNLQNFAKIASGERGGELMMSMQDISLRKSLSSVGGCTACIAFGRSSGRCS